MIYRQLLGCFLTLMLLLTTNVGWASATELSQEYRIKSAYLFNFTKFISWPQGTFQSNEQPLKLCVQDNQKMADFLHAMTTAQATGKNRREVNVKNVTKSEESADCHIFYKIKPQHKHEPEPEHEHLHTQKACDCLIIGDTPMHQSWGSTINFYHDKRRIRFAVDLRKLDDMDISISSELLKLANIYNKKSTKASN